MHAIFLQWKRHRTRAWRAHDVDFGVSLRDRNAHGHVNRAIALKIIGNMTPAKNRDAQFVRVPTINQHFDMSQKQVYVIHASVFEVPHTW